jgi:hypothetical protein
MYWTWSLIQTSICKYEYGGLQSSNQGLRYNFFLLLIVIYSIYSTLISNFTLLSNKQTNIVDLFNTLVLVSKKLLVVFCYILQIYNFKDFIQKYSDQD